MFENVLAQDSVIGDLKRTIETGTVPGSLLFEGPAFSGKLTAALEFARVLACTNGVAQWNCGCRSCRDHRLLIHDDTKLIGPGIFMPEILASADVLHRIASPASRYLFIRSVRKMIRRLDPDLWDESNKKIKTARSSMETIYDLLESLTPDGANDSLPVDDKSVKGVIEASEKLAAIVPGDSIPVDQIRRLSRWSHQTTGGRAKVAIIANAESMGDSSRNALLKTLEEPPESTYFVLTSASPEALIPTIRSRLRPFRFNGRNDADSRNILERIFRDTGDEYTSLSDYFMAWSVSPEIIKSLTATFIDAVQKNTYATFFDDNRDLERITGDREIFLAYLSQLLMYTKKFVGSEATKVSATLQIDAWNHDIKYIVDSVRRFNITPGSALEALFYKMRQTT